MNQPNQHHLHYHNESDNNIINPNLGGLWDAHKTQRDNKKHCGFVERGRGRWHTHTLSHGRRKIHAICWTWENFPFFFSKKPSFLCSEWVSEWVCVWEEAQKNPLFHLSHSLISHKPINISTSNFKTLIPIFVFLIFFACLIWKMHRWACYQFILFYFNTFFSTNLPAFQLIYLVIIIN